MNFNFKSFNLKSERKSKAKFNKRLRMQNKDNLFEGITIVDTLVF